MMHRQSFISALLGSFLCANIAFAAAVDGQKTPEITLTDTAGKP